MALTEKNFRESFRLSFRGENGEVMSANASYGKDQISINFDLFDYEYCTSHPEEMQESVKSFISRLNDKLVENNLPTIHA